MVLPDNVVAIAACGINCGVCRAFLRKRNRCPGCRAIDAAKPVSRVTCKIKTCDFFQSGRGEFCGDCGQFPCAVLRQLDKRYSTKYAMSVIENLESIKNSGLDKFLETEKTRWTCAGCGGTICVHTGDCQGCGRKI